MGPLVVGTAKGLRNPIRGIRVDVSDLLIVCRLLGLLGIIDSVGCQGYNGYYGHRGYYENEKYAVLQLRSYKTL